MKKTKALIVSMPWAEFQFPSIQVGCLVSHARSEGFDVDGRHFHLEIAAFLGLERYDEVVLYDYFGELFAATLLFPSRKKKILKYLDRFIPHSEKLADDFLGALKKVYRSTGWKKYGLVGFTVNYDQLFSSLLFADWLKRDHPEIKIVFGGTCVRNELGTALLECFPQVDWCVDGEGEISLTELLSCLENDIADVENHVPGLIYRKDSAFKMNQRKQLPKLDSLPDPDFDHYFDLLNSHPLLKEQDVVSIIPLECSRGCPHRCAFCTVHDYWSGYRMRSTGDVANQMKRMLERYHVNRFQFTDATTPTSYWKRLFPILKEHDLDYFVYCQIRATSDRKGLEEVGRTSKCMALIGIESLSSSVLKKMNKGIRAIDNIQCMKFCEELGVTHMSNLIVDFPTETQNDIDEAIKNMDFASAYRPPFRLVDFILFQGSPVYNQPDKYGITGIATKEPFDVLLPSKVTATLFPIAKGYVRKRKFPDQMRLMKRFERWHDEYNASRTGDSPLLAYYDCGSFLRIEDFRIWEENKGVEENDINIINLERDSRELYLFCDSYKSFNKIKARFPKWDPKEIKKVLGKLVKLKVMFREDDDYLSLAIRANGPIKS